MDAKADAIVQQAVATTIADAERLWAPEKFDGVYPTKGFGIKRLEKFDLAPSSAAAQGSGPFTNSWILSITTAKTWVCSYADPAVSDSSYLIITGIFNYDASPDVSDIQIIADGVEYPTMNIEEMYGWDIATAYLSHPIIVRPEKTINVYTRAETAGRKNFGLLGYVVGKRSYIIGRVNGT
jgi:hypothetical protein